MEASSFAIKSQKQPSYISCHHYVFFVIIVIVIISSSLFSDHILGASPGGTTDTNKKEAPCKLKRMSIDIGRIHYPKRSHHEVGEAPEEDKIIHKTRVIRRISVDIVRCHIPSSVSEQHIYTCNSNNN